MILKRGFSIVVLLCLSAFLVKGQDQPSENPNTIQFRGNSLLQFERLFSSFSNLIKCGEGTINIIHIGDSHVQADFFTGQVRERLTTEIARGCGARGLIFPFRMARTNNPSDYYVKFTGKWESCRNVETKKSCSLGLDGIMVRTQDSISEIAFYFKGASSADFKTIRIYHELSESGFRFEFPGLEGKYTLNNDPTSGFSEVTFSEYLKDSLKFRIVRSDTLKRYFTLYGVDFENEDAGIVYHSAGINGAEVVSFLRCDLLEQQLASLTPGLIILSLGTNDAYPVKIDWSALKEHYQELIRKIRSCDPKLPILLTIPGDSFRKRKFVNKNLPILREVIFEVAKENDCAVWDFYTLMGGPKSIQKWYKSGLVAKDKLHFNKAGYIIQGNLLADALIDAYMEYLDRQQH